MAILMSKDTRVLVQGITGREGRFHTQRMLEYGTNIVAGVTPGKGGEWVEGVPVFDSVEEAVRATQAEVSVIFVPARFAADAILEAADAGIRLIVTITEGIPIQDMMRVVRYLDEKGARLVGPNCPGILVPGQTKAGIIPGNITMPGPVGIVSRSGTLTYEVMYALKNRGIGVSTTVGIGGDPVHGLGFIEVLGMFEEDPETKAVVLIGEIGGTEEQDAAAFIHKHMSKPVVAYIAGRTAPPGKRMGHAGAIVEGGEGTAEEKIRVLESMGVQVAPHPEAIAELIEKVL